MRLPSILLAGSVGLALAACGGGDDAWGAGLDAGSGVDLDAATSVPAPTDAGTDASSANDGLVAVTLRFRAAVGADELACGRVYPGQGSGKIAARVQDFRMLLQDVTLIAADGQEVPVQLDERAPYQTREVALLDFTDAKDGCVAGDPGSNTLVTGRVPPGSYRALRFRNGVPEALNHADLVTAPPPLRMPGLSWSWLQGYRFVVAEMVEAPAAPIDGGMATPPSDARSARSGGGHNASRVMPGVAMVHVGSTSCGGSTAVGFRCGRGNRNQVELRGFDPAVNTVVADLGAVFMASDIAAGLLCHGLGNQCVAPFAALGVDSATGQAAPAQRVFRVE